MDLPGLPNLRQQLARKPPGISGAAAWVQGESKGPIWAPTFTFAGICTHAYRDGMIERVIKASTVRKFLRETLGPIRTRKAK